jgi:pimeloyl-ACP methyl ester carboxylesterase
MTGNPMKLFSTSHGDRDQPTLLLVHGWGGDGREWSACVEALADRYQIIVPDLRGHGRSPVPEEGNTPRAMAADLAELLAGQVVAVGHSMGGQVVNLLAIERPDLVQGVVTLEPAHGAHGEEAADVPHRLARYQRDGARAAAEFVAGAFGPGTPAGLRTAHVRTILGTPDHVIAQTYAGMYTEPDAVGLRPRSEAYLKSRRCPAVTVWSPAEFAAWERAAGGQHVEHWPGVGHYLHEERTEDTVRLIDTFASTLS